MKKLILWICVGLPALGFSQTYTVDWFKIAGGGGTSTGGAYAVSGTIGQPEAGGAMTGGNFSITGGFWSLLAAVQTPGAPLLTITRAGNSVLVSWPNTAGFTLETNGHLNAGAWTSFNATINTTNGINSVTLSPPAGNLFFRLRQ
jgi:hypothetical protein